MPVIFKDRKSSFLYISFNWTEEQLRNLSRPLGSTRFRVIYYTTATDTGRGTSGWLSLRDFSPWDWISAQGWPLKRVSAVVFDKA